MSHFLLNIWMLTSILLLHFDYCLGNDGPHFPATLLKKRARIAAYERDNHYIPLNSLTYKAANNDSLFEWMYQGPSILREIIKHSKLGGVVEDDPFKTVSSKPPKEKEKHNLRKNILFNSNRNKSSSISKQYTDESSIKRDNIKRPENSSFVQLPSPLLLHLKNLTQSTLKPLLQERRKEKNSSKSISTKKINVVTPLISEVNSIPLDIDRVFEHLDLPSEHDKKQETNDEFHGFVLGDAKVGLAEIERTRTSKPGSNSDIIWIFTTSHPTPKPNIQATNYPPIPPQTVSLNVTVITGDTALTADLLQKDTTKNAAEDLESSAEHSSVIPEISSTNFDVLTEYPSAGMTTVFMSQNLGVTEESKSTYEITTETEVSTPILDGLEDSTTHITSPSNESKSDANLDIVTESQLYSDNFIPNTESQLLNDIDVIMNSDIIDDNFLNTETPPAITTKFMTKSDDIMQESFLENAPSLAFENIPSNEVSDSYTIESVSQLYPEVTSSTLMDILGLSLAGDATTSTYNTLNINKVDDGYKISTGNDTAMPSEGSSPLLQLNVWNYLNGHLKLTETQVLPSSVINLVNNPHLDNPEDNMLTDPEKDSFLTKPNDEIATSTISASTTEEYIDSSNQNENPYNNDLNTDSEIDHKLDFPMNLYEFILDKPSIEKQTETPRVELDEHDIEDNKEVSEINIDLSMNHHFPLQPHSVYVKYPQRTETTEFTTTSILTTDISTSEINKELFSSTISSFEDEPDKKNVLKQDNERPNYPLHNIIQTINQNNNLNSNVVNTHQTNQHIININNSAPPLQPISASHLELETSDYIPNKLDQTIPENNGMLKEPSNTKKQNLMESPVDLFAGGEANSVTIESVVPESTSENLAIWSDNIMTSTSSTQPASDDIDKGVHSVNDTSYDNDELQQTTAYPSVDVTKELLKKVDSSTLVQEFIERVSIISKLFPDEDLHDPKVASMIENMALESLLAFLLEKPDKNTKNNSVKSANDSSDQLHTKVKSTTYSLTESALASSGTTTLTPYDETIIPPKATKQTPGKTTIYTTTSTTQNPPAKETENMTEYAINIFSKLIIDNVFDESDKTIKTPTQEGIRPLESSIEAYLTPSHSSPLNLPVADVQTSLQSSSLTHNDHSDLNYPNLDSSYISAYDKYLFPPETKPFKNNDEVSTLDYLENIAIGQTVDFSDYNLNDYKDTFDSQNNDFDILNSTKISTNADNNQNATSITDTLKNSFTKITSMISNLIPSDVTFNTCLSNSGCAFALASSLAIGATGALAVPFVLPLGRKKRQVEFEESRIFSSDNFPTDDREKLKDEFHRILTFLALNEGKKRDGGVHLMKGNVIKYLSKEFDRISRRRRLRSFW